MSTVSPTAPVHAPMPPGGFLLVEASAGTGKTWLTEALFLRLIAEEDVPVAGILTITFTRAATAELRARVRGRLADARAVLANPAAAATPQADPALERLRTGVAVPPSLALARVERALANFDQAPISTIHSFCQAMLEQFSHLLDLEPKLKLAPDTEELTDDVVADELARVYVDASWEEIAIYEKFGWDDSALRKLVKLTNGPVVPVLAPAPAPSRARAVRAWVDAWNTLSSLLLSEAGQAYLTRLEVLVQSKVPTGKGTTMMLMIAGTQANSRIVEPVLAFAKGDIRTLKLPDDTKARAVLDLDVLRARWQAPQPLEEAGLDLEVGQRLTEALRAAKAAIPDVPHEVAARLYTFATRARADVQAALRRRGLLTYDTMLATLAAKLKEEAGKSERPIAENIRRLYPVAIVDEFQDTDLAQWTTLQAVFRAAHTRLIAVGDPKQSIYQFRSADIAVYLTAREQANTATLDVNFRSDAGLIAATNQLWYPETLEDEDDPDALLMGPGIAYVDVKAHHPDRLLRVGATEDDGRRPIALRCVAQAGSGGLEWVNKSKINRAVAQDCADAIQRMLEDESLHLQTPLGLRRLRFRDFAVLVATHAQAAKIRRALNERGIPAIANQRQDRVEQTAAADWLLAWLDALSDVDRDEPARRWVITPLVGWSPLRLGHAMVAEQRLNGADTNPPPITVEIAAALRDAGAFDDLREELRTTAEDWKRLGFWRSLERSLLRHDVFARLLRAPAGQRDATDLRQLMGALAESEVEGAFGPAALADALRRVRTGRAQGDESESGLELETDASAVRIVTRHASKGLQYPIVLLPFAWDAKRVDEKGPFAVSETVEVDGKKSLVRTLYFAPDGDPVADAARALAERRLKHEQARLLYVATTRAEHHLIAWVGFSSGGGAAPIMALLGHEGKATPAEVQAGIDDFEADLPPLATHPGPAPIPIETSPARVPFPERPWPSAFGLGFQRTSYTQLAAGKAIAIDDVPELATLLADPTLRAPAPGHRVFPGGTGLGTFVHALLEHVDFPSVLAGPALARPDRADASGRPFPDLARRIGQQTGLTDDRTRADVLDLLPGWLTTPLHLDPEHPSAPWSVPYGLRLADLSLADRRDELDFDLALAAPGRRVDPVALNALIDNWLAAPPEPGAHPAARDWLAKVRINQRARELAEGTGRARSLIGRLRGLLTGSIDLLLRVPLPDGGFRYWVSDYKTNAVRGPASAQAATAALGASHPVSTGDARQRNLHFSGPLLAHEMAHAAYHLQSLIYTVALHRLLAQRLPGYRAGGEDAYQRHVGGHLYLFVRGMGGTNTPRHAGAALGVWADRWPFALVDGFEQVLRGVAREPADELVDDDQLDDSPATELSA